MNNSPTSVSVAGSVHASCSPSWTEERVELLTKLWGDGLSASQIAKALGGVTRNAVIGKVHRLGNLPGRARDHAANIPKGTKTRAPRSERIAPNGLRVIERPADLMPSIALEPALDTAKAFTDRSRAECVWPVGDVDGAEMLVCASPAVVGKSYCACHQRMAYQPGTHSKRKLNPEWGRQPGAPHDSEFGGAWAA